MKKTLFTLGVTCFFMYTGANATDLYKKCAGCHGLNGEKTTFSKLQGLSKDTVVSKLKGYQEGHGGAKKAMMFGQVKSLSPEQIDALALHISKF